MSVPKIFAPKRDASPLIVAGRTSRAVPTQVASNVLLHPSLSLAARGLFGVMEAEPRDPEAAAAITRSFEGR